MKKIRRNKILYKFMSIALYVTVKVHMLDKIVVYSMKHI